VKAHAGEAFQAEAAFLLVVVAVVADSLPSEEAVLDCLEEQEEAVHLDYLEAQEKGRLDCLEVQAKAHRVVARQTEVED
jgi:hypothetical protein